MALPVLEPTHRLDVIEITIEAVRHYTILELRERRGLSQGEVSEGAGVSVWSINKIENKKGPFGINIDVADRLSKFFGIPMEEVAWPFALTDAGRPGGTGAPCKKARQIQEKTCPVHFIALPISGICGDCE